MCTAMFVWSFLSWLWRSEFLWVHFLQIVIFILGRFVIAPWNIKCRWDYSHKNERFRSFIWAFHFESIWLKPDLQFAPLLANRGTHWRSDFNQIDFEFLFFFRGRQKGGLLQPHVLPGIVHSIFSVGTCQSD